MNTATNIDMNASAVERLQAAINAFGQPRIVEEKSEIIEDTIRTSFLLNAITEEFIRYVYTPNPNGNGLLCITASGYIKKGVVAPWSFSNKATTRVEKKRIRSQFMTSKRHGHAPLFIYDRRRKCWQLNVDKYPTLDHALAWFAKYKLPSLCGNLEPVPLR